MIFIVVTGDQPEIHGFDDTMYKFVKKNLVSPNGTLQGTLVPYIPGVQSLAIYTRDWPIYQCRIN